MLIKDHSWGSITLDNGDTFGNVVIRSATAGNAYWNWDWNYLPEAMHHNPGYRRVDVDNLIFNSIIIPDNVILSTGYKNALKISGDIIDYIRSRGIGNVYIADTLECIRLYNSMERNRQSVVALIHSTC